MTDLAGVLGDVRAGMIPAHIYNDSEIFALEKQRLFSRAWLFVAHMSEIPQSGDYVVRRVLQDSFIIARDSLGEVRAMFNMCLHRGMQVCRAEMGNASNFRCPYHGWSYRNDGRLIGLPFHDEAYGGEAGFKKAGQTLLPAPNVASYNGLIFISMDPDAEPLEDFWGFPVLPGFLYQAECQGSGGAGTAALAYQGELEDRGGKFRWGYVSHPADAHIGG